MQKMFIDESTCVACSVGLNIHPKEHTKKMNTELLIVGITIKLFVIRNPINYASPIYRMSIRETLVWPFRRKREQNLSYRSMEKFLL